MEYRSGGTRGPYPGVDIFPDLSPWPKPYSGGKVQPGVALTYHILLLLESKTGVIYQQPRRKLTYSPV